MMGRSAGFIGIIADLGPLLFAIPGDKAAVKIEVHIVEMELFEEPLSERRECGIVAFPGKLMKEPAVGAL